MSEVMKVVRGISVVIMIVLYAVLVHHVNVSGAVGLLAVVLAAIPPFLFVFAIAIKAKYKFAGIALILAFIGLVWKLFPYINQHISVIFWLQDIGLMLLLLITFAHTLLQGQKPLCVHFAEMINGGQLPIAHERYARSVTIAWVIFFAVMMIVSTLLFFLAPLPIWSIFVNFLTLPLVALMFVGEYIIRRHTLTDLPAGSVTDAVRAYLNNSRRV